MITIDPDQGDTMADIAKDLHMSETTVVKIVRKFRKLMRIELVMAEVIENEEYCRVDTHAIS